MLRLDAFTAAPKLFSEAKRLGLGERIELFMVDYDLVPLLVQQAFPDAVQRSAAADDRVVALKGIGVQGHSAQYLAILAQCRVALNSPIQVEGTGFTVADTAAMRGASSWRGSAWVQALRRWANGWSARPGDPSRT
jgi:hypothetical protein